VVLGGQIPDWKQVRSGVPQGSVLGPILFLIFIGDLDKAAGRETLLRKFADDTKLSQVLNSEDDNRKLKESLTNMNEWAKCWGMKFNAAKCKVMHVGRGNAKHKYYLDGHQLVDTEVERDIGVQVSKNMKPGEQCEKVAKTAMSVLGQITRAFSYRDKRTFVALYKRYFWPHLEFEVPAWSPWLEKDKEVLEKVQIRMLKQVQGLNGTTYEQKLKEVGLETLEFRRKEADMMLVYKIMNGKVMVDRSKWFDISGDNRNVGAVTRSAADGHLIKAPFAHLDLRKNFFTARVSREWNRLPATLGVAKSPTAFKNGYRARGDQSTSSSQWSRRDC
jgi:ribonucleases P/MRP protein subunit RPP40